VQERNLQTLLLQTLSRDRRWARRSDTRKSTCVGEADEPHAASVFCAHDHRRTTGDDAAISAENDVADRNFKRRKTKAA